MKYVYLSLASAACVAALLIRLTGGGTPAALGAMALATIFLALGLHQVYSAQEEEVVTVDSLDAEQREEIERLLAENRFGTAVAQVRLWHRNLTEAEAAELVRELAP